LVLWVTALYCAPARAKPRKGHQANGGGLFPELAAFGFHHGQSAALASKVSRQAALLASFELARQDLGRSGLKLDIKTVHATTHRTGRQLLIARRADLERYRQGQMPPGEELAGKRVVVQLDGGRIRLRKRTRKQKGKGKSKKQKRRYQGNWREPKLLTIYEIDENGRLASKSRARIDGTFQGPDEVMELLAMHLHRLGAAQAAVLVFLADGAPWIWERLGWVVKRVGIEEGKVHYALDWCHALHHVGLALAEVRLAQAEHRRVFKKMRKWLKRGQVGSVLDELERLGESRGVLQAMATPLAFLDKHLQAGHLDYDELQSGGLPIGSGAIESAIRRVINQRLKGNSLMWYEGNAEGMLLLRAAALTGRWDEAMQQALLSYCTDGQLDWTWTSPDLPFLLKANASIQPPSTQPHNPQQDKCSAA
jgi:hypothetical protein